MGQPSDAAIPRRSFTLEQPETFYKAQKRNRRATWRMSFLCFIAALLMGIPLTLVLTPLFYAVTLIGAEIWNYFSPLPSEILQNVNTLGQLAAQVGDYYFNHKGAPPDLQTLALVGGLLLLPGIVIAFVL